MLNILLRNDCDLISTSPRLAECPVRCRRRPPHQLMGSLIRLDARLCGGGRGGRGSHNYYHNVTQGIRTCA